MSRWGRLAALLLAAILGLTACAAIPTGGSVGTSQATGGPNVSVPNANFNPQGPSQNDSPQAIIHGFISAAVGVADSFQTARKFLTPDVSNTWKGSDQTVVFRGEPRLSPPDSDGTYRVEVDVKATVDADGVMTRAPAGTQETWQYSMNQINGQWRISELPQGILLEEGFFQSLFQSRNLYFYDPAFTVLVPDTRWFPSQRSPTQGNAIATLIVKALLNGAAPYLRGAVTSAFPESVKLLKDSVPVSDGQAVVDLTSQPLLEAGPDVQRKMQQQLFTSLQLAVGVNSVQMRADQTPVTFPSEPEAPMNPPTAHAPIVDNRQIGVSNDRLVWVENDSVSPVEGTPQFSAPPRYPAQSYARGSAVAFLSADLRTLYTVSAGESVLEQLSGVPLSPPSFGPDGWVWSAATDGSGRVFALKPGVIQKPLSFVVDWLKDRKVTSLKIARDGARALIVSSANGNGMVTVSGILKQDDAVGSAPQGFTDPQRFYPPEPVERALWTGESQMIVYQAGDGPIRPIELSLDADPKQPTAINDLRWLSVGNTVTSAYAQTASGMIYARFGNSWNAAAFTGVADLAFPG
ncbi:LpqB family beta-propeller domain-containing protein [Acaricomes phytoseiuli]|uniref:LpqB family beta-propeller domain-containing protein n=1 Tax=Acaricomes phytoseiuli TaxID=291968 RepID=UPI002223E194|nr:LpqB family beta-propeller domain-containing protein [Acaricomes phytoseiuli]MCW1249422.1 LpqB family beta-propeller domain-containing protein [Acaricomes phytoseiuli]